LVSKLRERMKQPCYNHAAELLQSRDNPFHDFE
jgi:hypothetical protein